MYGLGRSLISGIFRAKNLEIVKAILSHKNAKFIPATGMFSLASAILNAIDVNNVRMVLEILPHSNIKLIPADGHYGYLNCLKKAEKEGAMEIHALLVQLSPLKESSSRTNG